MRFEGELVEWDDEVGHGTIRPAHGGDDVVVGLRAFPMDGEIPHLGEMLSFEIVTGRDGRKRAANLHRVESSRFDSARMPLRSSSGAQRYRRSRQRRRVAWWLGVVSLLLGLAGGYQWWQGQHRLDGAPVGLKR